MSDALERFRAWLNTHEGKKLFRYSMVSVISTGVSFITLFLVYGVFRAWTEVPSTVFANAVATFPSYWLNRQWAWGKSGRSHFLKEIVPFWIMSALGIAFSVIGAALARHIGQTHHLSHSEQTGLVLLANLVSFAIFWVAKLIVFNRVFHVPTLLEEIDEHIDEEEHPPAAVGSAHGLVDQGHEVAGRTSTAPAPSQLPVT